MLSIRRRVDHIIEFKTTPSGLNLAPGNLIRVQSEASPYDTTRNGVIDETGLIKTPSPLDDGEHRTFVYRPGSDKVEEIKMQVKDNRVDDPSLFGALFNTPNTTRRFGFYQIETLGIEEDGAVMITASHHPVFADLKSKIVYDVLTEDEFVIVEEVQP